MRDQKATRDDDVLGDVLKQLGEDGLKLQTQLISNLYETGERPQNFPNITMIALTF